MMCPRAIILDFDGVIVQTESGKFIWLKRALRQYGIILRKSDFGLMTGRKTAAFLKERFGEKLGDREILEIKNAWRQERTRNYLRYSRPIRGVVQFIKSWQRNGIKLCLATGTERAIVQKSLRSLGILDAFPVMITGNECALSKPNPQVYRLAIKALNTPAREILVIEDSAAGVIAAKRAGLRCAAITTTHKKSQLKQADIIVDSFIYLKSLIDDCK